MPAVIPSSSSVMSATQTGAQQKIALGGMADALAERVNSFTTTGTATAFVGAPVPAITSYFEGLSFFVRFHLASGAAPTLAVSGLATPPNLVKQNPDGSFSNIVANDIPTGHRSRVTLISATQALVESLPPQRIPAFAASIAAGQPLTSSVPVVIFGAEQFDTDNCHNVANGRFTPTAAGYYQVNAHLVFPANVSGNTKYISIFKNGAEVLRGGRQDNTTNVCALTVAGMVAMNGTTDYLTCNAYLFPNGTLGGDDASAYHFSAHLARAS